MAMSNNNNNNATAIFSQSTEIDKTVTHAALDFIETPSVLVNYEGSSFDQEVLPMWVFADPSWIFL